MNEYCKNLLELAKACSIRRVTASAMITDKPCYVFAFSATPTDAAALYEGAVHNGETSIAEILIDFESQYAQEHHEFALPIYFNKGIYVALTVNVKSITIQYLEEPV